MKIGYCVVLSGLLWATQSMAAGKDCEELKSEIAAKLDAKGVSGYELKVVTNEDAATEESTGWKVVGSCEASSKKIVYKRGG